MQATAKPTESVVLTTFQDYLNFLAVYHFWPTWSKTPKRLERIQKVIKQDARLFLHASPTHIALKKNQRILLRNRTLAEKFGWEEAFAQTN